MDSVLWALMGVIAGACVAAQAPINASLGRALEVPIAAAAVSFLAGGVVLWVLAFLFSQLSATPINFAAPAAWTFVAGGLLGAFYVFSNLTLTPIMGAAAVMALSVTGQLLAGLFLDKIGFMGMAVRELSVGRIAGAGFLVLGAVMIRVL
ncbi:MAG: DMT family transporter [Devosia sp.]|uniref:DMT family transporter n=1 Tax=Devosia sp. TaxID=1871048 RepID=UPI0024CBBE1C|nr:DMT family transporter [Devosia sp.]UYO00105.1 MAG: DMT family transporter [Devosia sp.]